MGGTLTLVWSRSARTQYASSEEGTVRVRKPRTCTLLGPEGPGLIQSDENWELGPFLVGHNSAGGEGTARTLRTTQWTRAS